MKEIKGLNFKGKTSEEPYYLLTIVADENDADYQTRKEQYSEEEFENKILPLVFEVKGRYSDRHEFERIPCAIYDELPIPSGEWDSCHTLESISLLYVDANGTNDVMLDETYINDNIVDIVVNRVVKYMEEEDITFGRMFNWECADVMGIELEDDFDEIMNFTEHELKEMLDEYNAIDRQILEKLIELAKVK